MNDKKQPFLSHLEELRKRLITCAVAIGVCFVGAFIVSEELFGFLIAPAEKNLPEASTFIFTNLTEMIFTYLKTAFIAGILIASPVIFHQMWMFIAPGLYQSEKKYIIPFVISSSILFVGGALFGYFIVFPFGFDYLLGYANESFKAMPSVKEYFSLASKLLLAFGIMFELPVVIFFLTKIGIVNPALLKKKRKYAILLAFVMSAILTPPDPATQCMMAVPIILLYEAGIIVSWLAVKKKKEED
jgi:sec-independent protein translocase protein TatC